MTVIEQDSDHTYCLPGSMLAFGDRIVGLHRKGEQEWDKVSFLLTSVRFWTIEDGLKFVTFTTDANTEMTFKGSELFMVQLNNPEEKRK